jgi:hypothetical protein
MGQTIGLKGLYAMTGGGSEDGTSVDEGSATTFGPKETGATSDNSKSAPPPITSRGADSPATKKVRLRRRR